MIIALIIIGILAILVMGVFSILCMAAGYYDRIQEEEKEKEKWEKK